jgi:hypothetical protein
MPSCPLYPCDFGRGCLLDDYHLSSIFSEYAKAPLSDLVLVLVFYLQDQVVANIDNIYYRESFSSLCGKYFHTIIIISLSKNNITIRNSQ